MNTLTLKSQTIREALGELLRVAKFSHEGHTRRLQCDDLCDSIPAAEAAIAGTNDLLAWGVLFTFTACAYSWHEFHRGTNIECDEFCTAGQAGATALCLQEMRWLRLL